MKLKFLLLLIFVSHLVQGQDENDEIQRWLDTLKMGSSYLIGKDMRQFEGVGTNGLRYTSDNLKNKITFVNFWIESCLPCLAEVEVLNELYETFSPSNSFQYLSFTREEMQTATRFGLEKNIKYPIIPLSQLSCNYLNYGKGYPTSIIVDGTGKILFFSFGGALDPEKAKTYVKEKIYPVLKQHLGL